MGIRMLDRRPARQPLAPVPAFASGASTARIVLGPAEAVRSVAADLGRALARCRALGPLLRCRPLAAVRLSGTAPWRQWADLAGGYLALLLALLPPGRHADRVRRRGARPQRAARLGSLLVTS
ncbi:hypothetical protein [Streptomyces sp. NPDC058739]|uniref:hypothetical protein n=1 Tax=Streptomyces sp. NPDC058739 TaxID=3346618 RepID=UPI0036CA16F0